MISIAIVSYESKIFFLTWLHGNYFLNKIYLTNFSSFFSSEITYILYVQFENQPTLTHQTPNQYKEYCRLSLPF